MLRIDRLKKTEKRKRELAAIASILVPGLGQFIRKRIAAGLFFFLFFFLIILFVREIWKFNYGLIGTLLGLIVFYCLNVLDAYKGPSISKAPCTRKCPASINVPLYIALIREGKFDDALEVIMDRMPFPSVCGRICFHPCETVCSLRRKGGSVSIELLKRAASDFGSVTLEPTPRNRLPAENICVIGAGPAGLSTAYFLERLGYTITVYEKAETPGGILSSTLPAYRLSKDTALYDIPRILNENIQLKTGIAIGKDISFDTLMKKHNAIVITAGTQRSRQLNIEGVKEKGVLEGISFLQDVKTTKPDLSGKKVIVVGGGNVAIDCARSAARLGAHSIDMVCLESRDLLSKDRMPAHKWEIEHAENEGIKIHDQWGPKKILLKNDEIIGIELLKCTSVYEGKKHIFNPEFDKDKTQRFDADIIIIAIGQEPDFSFLPENIKQKIVSGNTIMVNHQTMQTYFPGIFAAGDITDKGKTVVEAVEMGRNAAIGVDQYIRKVGIFRRAWERLLDFDFEPPYRIPKSKNITGKRLEQKTLSAKDAISSFSEVKLGFTQEEARKEASRCQQCNRKQ